MRPYRIWIGGEYHKSGGIRALHVLQDELRARGAKVEMTYSGAKDREAIMVYPEIVVGNPENQARYVKWILNRAEHPGEDCWAWVEGLGYPDLLTVNIIELGWWKDRGLHRSGVAVWEGKGKADPSLVPEGATWITRQNFDYRQGLAEFVSGLDYLISFDPFTAVIGEAVVSGTPVLVYPSAGVHEDRTLCPYGVAWGDGNLEAARDTVVHARDHYESLLPVFAQRVDNFLEVTQRRYSA